MKTTRDLLIAAKARIEDPRNFLQSGDYINAETLADATCFCSIGAIDKERHESPFKYPLRARLEAMRALSVQVPTSEDSIFPMHITRYNDTHPHPEVMALWDRAIAEAS